MLAPSIKYTQGVTVGTPNVALMGVLTTNVTAQANTADGSKRWVFSWIDAPPTSAIVRAQAVQDSGSVSSLTFSPDVAGCYCLQLDSYDANGARATVYLCFGVLNAHGRLPSFPAMVPFTGFPEIAAYQCMNFSGGTRGYAPFVESYFAAVDAGGGGGSNATQLQGFNISNATPTLGQALIYDSTPNWAPHSPAGSIGGTFLATTVLAIDGTAGTAAVHCANVTFDDGVTPVISQAVHASGTPAVMTLEAQSVTTGNASNGGLALKGGKGSAAGGPINFYAAATTTYNQVVQITATGLFVTGSFSNMWHTFQNGFMEVGGTSLNVGTSGLIRCITNQSMNAEIAGGPGANQAMLAWTAGSGSGGGLTLGDASHTLTLTINAAGAVNVSSGGSTDLTLQAARNLVIQSATKWMKGGVSHAGWAFSDQADPQTTNNTPIAAYTFTANVGTNFVKVSVTSTRNDDAACAYTERTSGWLNNAGTVNNFSADAPSFGPAFASTGSTIAVTVTNPSSTTIQVNITGNTGETWNHHVEFEAKQQP